MPSAASSRSALGTSVKPILASQPDREVRAPLTPLSVYRLTGRPGNAGVTRRDTTAGRGHGRPGRRRPCGRHEDMVDLIPRSVLFGNPERTSPQISPEGVALAWIAPRDGVLNLWVAPIGGETGVDWDAARPVTEDADRGIRSFAWARDGQRLLYVQDAGGDENWRLYDVDLQTLARRDLTPFENIHTNIIGTSKRRPNEILVGINADNPQLHDVYRLYLETGQL